MKFRKGFWIYFPVALFAWISPIGVSTAKADSFTTTGAQDYFFTLNASQLFTVRTYAQQYGIDSMLWLYDSNNQVLAANDDWFGLDSYISRNLDAGTYRLRTGVCCGDPNRWYGTSYIVDVNMAPSNAPTTTTSTTTTLPPSVMNSPTNLQAVALYESVSLTWDAPQVGPGNAEVERYAVFFSSNNWQSSFAVASTTTSATINGLTTGVTYQFRVRADNDTLGVYSSMIETYTVSATPVTTTTSSTTSTTTTTTTSTTTTTEPPTTTTESTTTTSTEPQTTTTSTSTTSTTMPEPSTTLVENTTSTTTTSTVPPAPEPEPIVEVPTGTTTTVVEEPMPEETIPEETTTTTEPETTTTEASPDPTFEETTTTTLEPNLEPNLEPMTEEEVAAVVENLATIEEITPEVLSEVVNALNSDSITEEQVQVIVDAVVENLDTLTEITAEVLDEVLNVLESDSITEEQVQEIVDTILATDISSDQATQLATSAAVLESITGDQATEVFASIDTGELSGEEAAAIVEALLDAPTEVKEAFEEEINVFEGGFDDYVPTDSTVSVGVRRVVVAATTVSFILPAPVVSRRR